MEKRGKIIFFVFLLEIFLLPCLLSASPIVNLISPANNTNTNNFNQTFNCGITDASGVKSLELYMWDSNGLKINPDLSWKYSGISYNLSDQDISPYNVFFYGNYWFMVGGKTNKIYKYYSNWTYTGINYNLSSESSSPESIFYTNGNWFLLDASAKIFQYDSDWNYKGISYNLSLSEGDNSPQNIFYNGSDWFVATWQPRSVFQYDSNWIYSGISYPLYYANSARSIFFDGNNWLSANSDNNVVYKYSRDWTYTGISYDLLGDGVRGLFGLFYDSADWWYVVGSGTGFVYKYHASSALSLSGNSNSTLIGYNFTYPGVYNWNCLGTNAIGDKTWANQGNYTITIGIITPPEPNPPQTTIPLLTSKNLKKIGSLNCTAILTSDWQTDLTAYWKWYRNDKPYSSGTTSVKSGINSLITTIPSQGLKKGDKLICEVKPYDSQNYGKAKNSSSVKIVIRTGKWDNVPRWIIKWYLRCWDRFKDNKITKEQIKQMVPWYHNSEKFLSELEKDNWVEMDTQKKNSRQVLYKLKSPAKDVLEEVDN